MGARSSKITAQNNRSDGHLLEYFRNTFARGGGGTNFVPPILQGLTATGGVISDYTDGPAVYRAHIFTSSGTFAVSALATDPALPNSVEYLVVAGGGGGGDAASAGHGGNGGGGGGGYVEGTSLPVSTSPGSYTITVGAGGFSVSNGPATPGTSRNGTNSTISNPNINTVRMQNMLQINLLKYFSLNNFL
jgi:hypothetical protein